MVRMRVDARVEADRVYSASKPSAKAWQMPLRDFSTTSLKHIGPAVFYDDVGDASIKRGLLPSSD